MSFRPFTAASPQRQADCHPEDGFALIGMIVAIFLILLAISVAAPSVARSLRREREVEAVHRANQYDRAIQLYYKKLGHYPGSIEQLEKSNNIRFLRQQYNDPMTGKPDWRLIKVGENKTTVKGFFGQPLTGIASSGLGSAAGSASAPGTPIGSTTAPSGSNFSGAGSGVASASGGSTGSGSGSTGSPSSFGGGSTADSSATGGAGVLGTSTGGVSSTGLGTGNLGVGSTSGGGFSGTGSPFMGVGLPATGAAIIVVNEQTTYPEWEFLYDPRMEQLKAKVNLFGGGISSSSTSGLGSSTLPGSPSAPGSSTPNSASPTASPSAAPGSITAPQ